MNDPAESLLGCLPVQIDVHRVTERMLPRSVPGVDEGIHDHGRSQGQGIAV